MSQILASYRDIPEEDRKKANAFFERAAAVAGTGNYDYAIELYLQGLEKDPEAVHAHQALRDIALKRKASGGKKLGFIQTMALSRAGKDDKQTMLNAEKLLAFNPGSVDAMRQLIQSAFRAGYYDTVMWIGPILQKANADSPKPDFNTFIILKDIYKALEQWKLATDACQYAAMLRPDDMDLQSELKNLGAQQTMKEGNYEEARSFRDSIKDMKRQRELLEQDMDVRTEDVLSRQLAEAEAEWRQQPDEPGKIMRLVEALVRTEKPENEKRAMELLQQTYEATKQFRFRLNLGKIRLSQLERADRAMRAQLAKDRDNQSLVEEYRQFFRNKTEEELKEYLLWAENYPTDLTYKYEAARRLFLLERYSEAIPMFQTARQDPKIRVEASTYLGRAFLEAGFVDEAADTLRALIDEYQIKGDARSKEMYYWYGRALETRNDVQAALKAYSQVAQWDFNYRDVQSRIKKLRGGGGPASAA